MGSAVTAQAMPTPSTNCHGWPWSPIQPPQKPNSTRAARAPNTRSTQSQTCRQSAFRSEGPDLSKIQFYPCDPNKDHHGPHGDPVQGLDHRRREHEFIIRRNQGPQHTRPQEDSRHDLHHHQGCPILCSTDPPDQIRHRIDQDHGDQKDLRSRHQMHRSNISGYSIRRRSPGCPTYRW